jgi:flagellar M-ring protein FliF
VANEPPEDPAFETTGAATEGEGQAGGAGTFSSRSTRNFELDRRIEHTKRASGAIERLSVAVVVNALPLLPPAPEGEEGAESAAPVVTEVDPVRLERLTNLVRGAVGALNERGDLVTLEAVPFEPLPVPQGLPWYESKSLASVARTAMAGGLFLIILLTVVRPVLKSFLFPVAEGEDGSDPTRLLAESGELTEEELASIEIGEGESLEDIRAKLKPKKSSISADMLDTANTYDDKVALIRMIVNEDAGRVANVLKNMVRVG